MGKRKPFIRKKEALRFSVVHRSQRDPRLADPEASDFVLKESGPCDPSVKPSLQAVSRNFAEDESALREMDAHDAEMERIEEEKYFRAFMQKGNGNGNGNDASSSSVDEAIEREKFRGKKFGYAREEWDLAYLGLPKDGYDYSKHLKEIGGGKYYAANNTKEARAPNDVLLPPEDAEAYKRAEALIMKKKQSSSSSAKPVSLDEKVAQLRSELPDDVFGTAESEQLSYADHLNSAPGLYEGIDLEVAAMLTGEVEIESGDELEDDFVQIANSEAPVSVPSGSRKKAPAGDEYFKFDPSNGDEEEEGGEGREWDSDGGDAGSENDDDVDFFGDRGYYKEDPRFTGARTDYTERESLASTMSRRTQATRIIDERFEESLKEYDAEDAIGELDEEDEDVLGHLEVDEIDHMLDEFLDNVKNSRTEALHKIDTNDQKKTIDIVSQSKEVTIEQAESEIFELSKPKPREQWDCESIISTYSNLENHPKLIEAAKRRRKGGAIKLEKGLPVEYLPDRSKNNNNDEDGDDNDDGEEEEEEEIIAVPVRVKGETAEEKRARKQAVKEAKREARERKKQTKAMFKDEQMRQSKMRKGGDVSVRPL